MALVFGSLLNPQDADATTAETIQSVTQDGGRWLGMAVMYFGASVALTLGLPSMLSLFTDKGRRIGLLAVGVFTIGVIGTSGYAMLLVFFRALAKERAIGSSSLETVAADNGFSIFLYGWIAGFYLGLLLIAVALFMAKKTPMWVPTLLVVFVALFPVSSMIGRVGQVMQVMGLAIAFTGVAIAAVNQVHEQIAVREPSY
jgi:hypothetical protein